MKPLYTLKKFSVSINGFRWNMPKSKEKICVLRWEGKLGKVDFESFTKFSLLRIEQIRTLPYLYTNPMVIDLSGMRFEDMLLIPPFLLKISSKLPAGTKWLLPPLDGVLEIPEINSSSNIEEALSFIAFDIKQKRHDGGKSIVEPIHYRPIKLSQININTSALRFVTHYLPDTNGNIGIISFEGHYAKNDEEQNDALFIHWKLDEFIVLGQFKAVLVNLTKLSNITGEDLDIYPKGFTKPEDKIAFVIQENQKHLIKHYIFDGDEDKVFIKEKDALAFLKSLSQ